MTIQFKTTKPTWDAIKGDGLCLVRCELLNGVDGVSSGDHGEGQTFYSTGFWNPDSADGDDKNPDGWHVSGWDMSHDCWTSAVGFKVTGWIEAEDLVQAGFDEASRIVEAEAPKYLIWADGLGAWRRPNDKGYTRHLSAAGRYSRADAMERCGKVKAGDIADELPVLEIDALEMEDKPFAQGGVVKGGGPFIVGEGS